MPKISKKMKILMILRKIFHIIFFPLKLIYYLGIKRIVVFLAKDEIVYEKEKYEKLLVDYRKLRIEADEKNETQKILKIKFDRLIRIFNHYDKWHFDVRATEKDEMVYIFSFREKIFNVFYLCGIDGNHFTNDCRIHFQNLSNSKIKIVEITSNTVNRGYAKTLLKYTIEKVKENGIQHITGDLSYIDRQSFVWLIPFYKSLGFTYLKLEDDGIMDGIIEWDNSN